MRLGLAAGFAMLLGGCPAPSTRPAPEPSAPSQPSLPPPAPAPGVPAPAPSPTPAPREHHLTPATQSLVTRAHTLLSHGDLDGASSTIDRALRIEPGNPLLWVERGRVRLVEGDSHQAESCARKALSLAGGDRAAQAQGGHLLVDALRAQGRNPEAREVEGRSYMR